MGYRAKETEDISREVKEVKEYCFMAGDQMLEVVSELN